MKIFTLGLSVLAITVFAFPASSSADVRISLRNGRVITAEACRWQGNTLLCTKMGGSFGIDKKDVVGIEETGEDTESSEQEPSTPAEPAAGRETSGEAQISGARAAGADNEGGAGAAADELGRIRQRKGELAAEREELVKERQQLQADMKNAPDWMTVDRFEELRKKSRDLDDKINRFNSEVKALTEKENSITEGTKQKAQ